MSADRNAPSPRPRGRPRKAQVAPPAPAAAPSFPENRWVGPEQAARHLGVALATLWRGVQAGRLTPPAYPTERTPKFCLAQLDADMTALQRRPAESLAAVRLTARQVRQASGVDTNAG